MLPLIRTPSCCCWKLVLFLCLIPTHSFATTPNKSNMASNINMIRSQCACGKVQVKMPPTDVTTAVDCHCPACRKYHVAAFASYLVVPSNQVTIEGEDHLQTFKEACKEVGPVERLFCQHCYTKVASKPKEEKDDTIVLVNMGGLVDKTIPKQSKDSWSKERTRWQADSHASWATAKPPQKYKGGSMPPLTTAPSGSCACGKCQYQIRHAPYELQHCYCRLCRQLSGAAFQTWIPVENEDIVWNKPPPLIRTTEHGQRHICTDCGSVLTIVYDDQPEMTWPAAGGLDDATLPMPTGDYLQRVCHICCTWKQAWYTLPKDGLERIKYAC